MLYYVLQYQNLLSAAAWTVRYNFLLEYNIINFELTSPLRIIIIIIIIIIITTTTILIKILKNQILNYKVMMT